MSWPGGFSPGAVSNGILFDVEADFGFGRRGRRLKQRAEFLVDLAQRAIVQEEGLVNFSQAFENGGVGGEILAHFDKGTGDLHTHGYGARAVEDVGGHEGTVFGERVGRILAMLATARL